MRRSAGPRHGAGTSTLSPDDQMSLFALEQVLRGRRNVAGCRHRQRRPLIASSLIGARTSTPMIWTNDVRWENIELNPGMSIHVAGDLLQT